MSLLEMIARETNQYGNEDWVRSPRSNEDNGNGNSSDLDNDEDEDSNNEDPTGSDSDWDDESEDDVSNNDSTAGEPLTNRRTFFVPCNASHRDARHCCNGKWINVTPGYILTFLGILMYRGATKV